MHILSSGDITYFVYDFETKKCYHVCLQSYFQKVTNVLSVDMLAKFQRPFIKPISLQLDDIE